MNLPNNLVKSCGLATVVFWTVILAEESFNASVLPFAVVSVIPIAFCTTVVIVFTVCPFFWMNSSETINHQTIFKTCFPYYAIVAFSICMYGMYATDFSIFMVAFFTSAFITTCQSWVWFATKKETL